MRIILFLHLLFYLFACEQTIKNESLNLTENKTTQKTCKKNSNQDTLTQSFHKESNTNKINEIGLVDIQNINPSIQIDLKYATNDNFMKKKLYHNINRVYLQKDVALRLSKVQELLKKINSKYSLLVYDGVRPVSVQQEMWDALDTIPVSERTKFVSNPKNHSIHNYGAAVDLTICDEMKIPLDMGAGYDDIRLIAYPKLESKFLETGELSIEQVENRKLLRKIMASQGFSNIPTEWWHFNACSRENAKKRYKILK